MEEPQDPEQQQDPGQSQESNEGAENQKSDWIPRFVLIIAFAFLLISSFFLIYHFNNLLSSLPQAMQDDKTDEFMNYIQSARISWNTGEYQRTLDFGYMALNISKTDLDKSAAHYWIGIGYYNKGDLDNAQYHEELAISLYPEFSGPYVTLGAVFLARGNYSGSKLMAERAIELDPDFPYAYNLLGLSLDAQGFREEAILQFEKAISLNPENMMFRQNLENVRKKTSG